MVAVGASRSRAGWARAIPPVGQSARGEGVFADGMAVGGGGGVGGGASVGSGGAVAINGTLAPGVAVAAWVGVGADVGVGVALRDGDAGRAAACRTGWVGLAVLRGAGGVGVCARTSVVGVGGAVGVAAGRGASCAPHATRAIAIQAVQRNRTAFMAAPGAGAYPSLPASKADRAVAVWRAG